MARRARALWALVLVTSVGVASACDRPCPETLDGGYDTVKVILRYGAADDATIKLCLSDDCYEARPSKNSPAPFTVDADGSTARLRLSERTLPSVLEASVSVRDPKQTIAPTAATFATVTQPVSSCHTARSVTFVYDEMANVLAGKPG